MEASFRALAKGKSIVVVGLLNKLQSILVRFVPEFILLKISGAILSKVRKLDK